MQHQDIVIEDHLSSRLYKLALILAQETAYTKERDDEVKEVEDKLVRLYSEVTEHHYGNFRIGIANLFHKIGTIYFSQKMYAEALLNFNKAIDLSLESDKFYLIYINDRALANVCTETVDYIGAILDFSYLIQQGDAYPMNYYYRACCYCSAYQFEKENADYQNAKLALQKANADFQKAKALCLNDKSEMNQQILASVEQQLMDLRENIPVSVTSNSIFDKTAGDKKHLSLSQCIKKIKSAKK